MVTRKKYPGRYSMALAIRCRSGLFTALAALLLLTSPVREVDAASLNQHQAPPSYFPAWFKLSFLDLQQDLAEARSAGKQGVMVLFSIRGCAYCKKLVEQSLKEPAIEATLRRHFDVVHLDIHSDLELKDPQGRAMPVKAFARKEGALFSPTVAFYGLDGLHLLRVVGYQTPDRFRITLNQAVSCSTKRVDCP